MTNALFGMVVNNLQNAANFPAVPFNGLRLWDTGVTWPLIETAPGVFNWKNLDAQLAVAAAKGKDVLYTFGEVPIWANGSANFAAPPKDIDAGNLQWKIFVANLVIHSLCSTTAKIGAYEIWNEPNLPKYWGGTPAQLLKMARDAYTIIKALDPSAVVVGPAGSGGTSVDSFINEYYAAAVATPVPPFSASPAIPQDVFSYHAYLDDGLHAPTSLFALLLSIANTKKKFGIAYQPTWITEGSWGLASSYTEPLTADEQAAYLPQMFIEMWAAGIARFYWYAWDNTSGWGQLWSAAGMNAAGIAYGVLSGWLAGALNTAPVTANANNTLMVALAMANGAPAQIVWHPTAVHSLSTKAISYSTLDGKTYPVKNGTVTVSPKPILLTF